MNQIIEYQALANKTRLEILKLLLRKPLTIQEISDLLGFQPTSIRQHIHTLERAGFIKFKEKRTGTGGRPKSYYEFSKSGHLIGYPKRSYLEFSKMLMKAIQQSPLELDLIKETYKNLGVESGERLFKQIELENQLKTWSLKDIVDFYIAKYLEESGYEPEIIEIDNNKIVYRVHNCVLFEVAKTWPNIICDIFHEGFHEGLAKVTGGRMKIIRTKCMVNGATFCEYVCQRLQPKKT